MKMTSAYANKILRQLEEEKAYLSAMETDGCTYDAAEGETPVIPQYNYGEVSRQIADLDNKCLTIKHAINLSNATAQIAVGEKVMSVDQILVKMAQLNRRKYELDCMRKRLPVERLQTRTHAGSRNAVIEYRYANYDIERVKEDYEALGKEVMMLQIALDKYNQTFEFEVDI